MDHLAILDKKRKILAKIISGQKTIESRWYKSRIAPWDRIKKGETIYFKESGEPVRLKATVSEALQFYLPQTNVRGLLQKYGDEICFTEKNLETLAAWCSLRKYCILIRLAQVQEIEPFEIDKKGFGMMAAWITVPNIDRLKEKHAEH